MVDTSTTLCGVRLGNPLVLPAGIMGTTASSMARIASLGAGAVTTKSIGPEKREGHKGPVVVEVSGGLLNAVGLSCPGLDESLEELKKAIDSAGVPVIASIYGRTVEEFGIVAEAVSEVKPPLMEANISCPNIEDEFGKPFAADCGLAARVTRLVKEKTGIPLLVKLSPNVSDIKSIAAAVQEAGADGITAINTLGPGMAIDAKTAKPVLKNRAGGMSGPAVKPIALRCVYDIYEAVEIPVLGMGGVSCGMDAVEMLLAGACAVGMGTAVWKGGPEVFTKTCLELADFMEANGYERISDIVGKAHV